MKATSRIKTFDLRADFGLFTVLLRQILSETALKGKGPENPIDLQGQLAQNARMAPSLCTGT